MKKAAWDGLIAVMLVAAFGGTAGRADGREVVGQDAARRDVQRPADNADWETLIVELRHARAPRVGEHVRNLFGSPPRVRVAVDEQTNMLMVRAASDVIQEVRQVVDALEAAAERVSAAAEPRVRVRPLQFAHAEQLASSVLALGEALTPGGQWSVGLDRRTNSLLLTGPDETLNRIEEVLKELDRPAEDDAAPPSTRREPHSRSAPVGRTKPQVAPAAGEVRTAPRPIDQEGTSAVPKKPTARVRRPVGSGAAALADPPAELNVRAGKRPTGPVTPIAGSEQAG